jgi:aspartyl protease family protein
MGTFDVSIEVGDQAAQRFQSIDALVDTGATYTVLPRGLLIGLGVQPHRTSTFELGDGTKVELEMGRTWVRVAGQQEMTLVVFGTDAAAPILGAVTLEELLLGVDPVHKQLVPVNALLMGMGQAGTA